MSEYEALKRFDEYLDEFQEPVKVYGCEYDVSKVLKLVDGPAYREGFNNWVDMMDLEIA